jgi:hypothetical protein
LHCEALHGEVSDPVMLIHGLGCNRHLLDPGDEVAGVAAERMDRCCREQ